MKRRWIGSLLLIVICFLYGCSTKETAVEEPEVVEEQVEKTIEEPEDTDDVAQVEEIEEEESGSPESEEVLDEKEKVDSEKANTESEETMSIVLENPQPDEKVSAVVYYTYEQELTNELGEVVGSLSFKIPQLTLRSMEAGKINQDILAYYESSLANDFEFMSIEEWGSAEMPQLDRSIEAGVTYIDDNIICFLLLGYDYTGGAHGMPYRVPMIYDITTGEALYTKDLFNVDEAEFSNIYIEAFDKKIAESPSVYWDDAGKWVRETAVSIDSIDFYLSENGVIFYHSPYSLAPYSEGFVEVEVSYEQLPLKK